MWDETLKSDESAKWDDEVDVVCTGSGVAGLASAISVVDAGGEVFVADPGEAVADSQASVVVRSRIDPLRPWLGVQVDDDETNEYFAALSSDLGPLARSEWDVDMPIRVVDERVPVDVGGRVKPFFGSRLRDWTARCLASPSGYLYTQVSDWHSTTVSASDGDELEIAEIGSMTPDPDDIGGSVASWLSTQAQLRGIKAHPDSTLRRIVFEEGRVVGAVFNTSDGPLSVRARHGVIVATGGPQINSAARQQLADASPLRVCLVGREASRFGRVELLTSDALAEEPVPACRSMKRALHINLHETRGQLQTLRCGKVNGYPALGQ